MGRPRKLDIHLPSRVYLHHGSYTFREKDGKRLLLGKDLKSAMQNLDAIKTTLKTGDPYTVSRIYRSAKASAKTRGIDFSITKNDIVAVLQRAAGRCEITGIHFSNQTVHGARRRPWVASLDRIDSSKGYELGNIRLICIALNIAISDFGLDVFEKLATSRKRIMKIFPK